MPITLIAFAAVIPALCCAVAAIAMSLATSKSADAIARQPEAGGRINASLMFGLIMMETCAVYSLLVSILVIFILGGRA